LENRLRVELFIALCALLLSGVASIASVYQAHVIAQQFSATEQQYSATVWPYMTLTTNATDTMIQASITNDGLGPGIIRSVSIGWDGSRSLDSWSDMATTLLGSSAGPKTAADLNFTGTTGSLDPGDVIRAGDSRSLFALSGSNGFPARLAGNAVRHRLTVAVCYCSLLATCWLETWRARLPNSTALQDVEPREIRACPAAHGIAG
jgi:hypothetical protein